MLLFLVVGWAVEDFIFLLYWSKVNLLYPTCLLRNLYAGQEATVRTNMEQQTDSKLRKEHVKAVYCRCAYLTYMQSTS